MICTPCIMLQFFSYNWVKRWLGDSFDISKSPHPTFVKILTIIIIIKLYPMWIVSSMFLVKNVVKSTYYISEHRIVKKIHMKAWSYQYEMDFQWLKISKK
jgi:hypothetical protein